MKDISVLQKLLDDQVAEFKKKYEGKTDAERLASPERWRIEGICDAITVLTEEDD